ncbi:MAG: ModE family transcriptional regulator [Caulobacteraceae bacterium]|nr:ModE family transcriptional regulator [Caulobacteraceae bacterium]
MPQVGPLKLKAQVLCGEELAMGPGKADLLEAIAQEGSISGAGRRLGMSYRRTWLLVDAMNRCWTAPLVEAVAGGGQGRGARLTGCGREVLAAYRALEAALVAAASGEAQAALSARLLPRPRASQHEAV